MDGLTYRLIATINEDLPCPSAESEDVLLESPQPESLCGAPGINTSVTGAGDEMRVDLQGSDLWKRFHEIGTEMIITKAGR